MKTIRFFIVLLLIVPIPQSCDLISPCVCPEPERYKLVEVTDYEVHTRGYFERFSESYDQPTRQDSIQLKDLTIDIDMKGELIAYHETKPRSAGWTYPLSACRCPISDVDDELSIVNVRARAVLLSTIPVEQDLSEFFSIYYFDSVFDKASVILVVDETAPVIVKGDYWLDFVFETLHGEMIETSVLVNNLY